MGTVVSEEVRRQCVQRHWLPLNAGRGYSIFALNAIVDSFLNSQVEEQNVIPMVKMLADCDAAHIDAGIP